MLIAGQHSDNIVVFRVDADVSRCHLIDTGIEAKVPSPAVIKVLPNNNHPKIKNLISLVQDAEIKYCLNLIA